MLTVENLNVSYGDAQVLFDVSFHIEKNSIVSIVGANGAGKSTTLNAISGLVPKQSGKILFEGEDITHLPPHKIVELGIVQVPEGRRLFPMLSIEDNLTLGAYNQHARKNKAKNLEYVYTILPKLKERAKQLAGTLSGGERQMVAIGRALMAEPKVILMDEPSLGLAPIVVQDIFKLIQKIHEEGKTIILVEQNVNHALKMANYAYVLEIGRIVMHDTGENLLNNPDIKAAYLGL